MNKLQTFNEWYESYKGKEPCSLILYIHMPTGENEVVVNPNVEEKIKYINTAYDENLVHRNNKEIYIVDYIMATEEECDFSFGEALEELKIGKKLQRKGWNGKGLFVTSQYPDKHSKMTMPYLYIEYPTGERAPWVPSISDLFAEDWNVVG